MIGPRKTPSYILRLYFYHLFTVISSKRRDWKFDFTMTILAKISKALNSFTRMPWDPYWQKLAMVKLKNPNYLIMSLYTHTHIYLCTYIFKDCVSLPLILLSSPCLLKSLIISSFHFPKVLSNHWSWGKEIRGCFLHFIWSVLL